MAGGDGYSGKEGAAPRLPIEVVPGSRPPKFRWRQRVTTPGGVQWVEHEGVLPATLEDALVLLVDIARHSTSLEDHLRKRAEGLVEAVANLQKFKEWVHAYLDAQGVPREFPDGKHTKEGCRVGDRLDWLMVQLKEARERVAPQQAPARGKRG